jgi:hypothetical protein
VRRCDRYFAGSCGNHRQIAPDFLTLKTNEPSKPP